MEVRGQKTGDRIQESVVRIQNQPQEGGAGSAEPLKLALRDL